MLSTIDYRVWRLQLRAHSVALTLFCACADYSRMNYVTITGGGGHSALTYHRGGPLGDSAGGAGRELETIQQESGDDAQHEGARAGSKTRHPSSPTPSSLNHSPLAPPVVRVIPRRPHPTRRVSLPWHSYTFTFNYSYEY